MAKQKIDQRYPLRGEQHEGKVISNKMEKSATVKWQYTQSVPKYERYERRNTKITAHVPEEIDVEEGDTVKVSETRQISKTKSHIITEVVDQ